MMNVRLKSLPSLSGAWPLFTVFRLCLSLSGFALLLTFARPSSALTGATQDAVPDFLVPVGACTGALIAPNWILTARHVAGKIAVGRIFSMQGQSSAVARVHLSPNFRPATAAFPVPVNDIALIELDQPIRLDRYPALASRVTKQGQRRARSHRPTVSLYQYLPPEPTPVGQEDKKTPGKHIPQTAEVIFQLFGKPGQDLTLVIDGKNGVTLENNNSGAPLLINGSTVIGIAHSAGKSVTGQSLGFFGFVGNDKDWINQTTGFDVRWVSF